MILETPQKKVFAGRNGRLDFVQHITGESVFVTWLCVCYVGMISQQPLENW